MTRLTVNGLFHLHTPASDGLYKVSWYAEQAKRAGCCFLITDHGYLWSSVHAFVKYPDLHPWVGVEMYYKDSDGKGHLTLIAYTDEGVRTLYWLQPRQPLSWETLTNVSLEGVAVGTGCIGSVAREWGEERFAELERLGAIIVHEIFPYDDVSPQRDFYMYSSDLHALEEDLDALLLLYLSRPASRTMRWTGLPYHGAGMFTLYGGRVSIEQNVLTVQGDPDKMKLITGYGLTPKQAVLPESTITPKGVGNALPDLPPQFAPDPRLVRERIEQMGYPVDRWAEEWEILTHHGYDRAVGAVAQAAIALSKVMPVGYRGSGAASPTLNALLWGNPNVFTMSPSDLQLTDYRRFVDWSDAVREYPPDIDLDVPRAIEDTEFPLKNVPHTRAAAVGTLQARSIALNILRNALRTTRDFTSDEDAAAFLTSIVGERWRMIECTPTALRPVNGFWLGTTPTWTPVAVLPKALKLDILPNSSIALLPPATPAQEPVFLAAASHLHSPIPARLAYKALEKNGRLSVADIANIISVHRPGTASAPLLRAVFGDQAESAAQEVGLPFEDGLVWQEDVYAMVFDAARARGYNTEEAATLARKAMKAVSKKRTEDLEGINKTLGLRLEPAYTFNRAHALAYATYAHRLAHMSLEAWRANYETVFTAYNEKSTEAAFQTLATLILIGGILDTELLLPTARSNKTLVEEYRQAVEKFASDCTPKNYSALRKAERGVFRLEVSTLRVFGETIRNLWSSGAAPWVGVSSGIMLKMTRWGQRVERYYMITPHAAVPLSRAPGEGKVFVMANGKMVATTPKSETLSRVRDLSLIIVQRL